MTTTDDEFCLIRYSTNGDFDIVPQQCVRSPSNAIEMYEIYQVENNGNQCEGTVLLKGTDHFSKLEIYICRCL